MLNFYDSLFIRRAISEEVSSPQLKHLNHPEENIFHHNGFEPTHKALSHVHNYLKSGEKHPRLHVSTKADGSPSIVYGHHPKTGKFFVATKSAFNKKPKINYTHEDIEKNHGHAPGLVAKLKEAHTHLQKIMPKHGGVYQGDVMFGHGDKTHKSDGSIHFKPNTINYSVDKSHGHHDSVKNAHFGIATHTQYEGTPDSDHHINGMVSSFDNHKIKMKNHKDVHQSDLTFKHDGIKYDNHKEAEHHLNKAKEFHDKLHPHQHEAILHHGPMMKTYINSTIRNGTKPHIDGYHKYAHEKLQKEVDKLKSEKGKARKTESKNEYMHHLETHKDTLHNALQIHDHIQTAKNHITTAMNTANHHYHHSVSDKKTNPEGFVATHNGTPIKLVHRHEFSKLNFDNSANR